MSRDTKLAYKIAFVLGPILIGLLLWLGGEH